MLLQRLRNGVSCLTSLKQTSLGSDIRKNIAMLMLDRMEELGMSQKQLAEKMNCSPQYISKVLRGQENLSLETLTKIENALEISLIKGEPVAV